MVPVSYVQCNLSESLKSPQIITSTRTTVLLANAKPKSSLTARRMDIIIAKPYSCRLMTAQQSIVFNSILQL